MNPGRIKVDMTGDVAIHAALTSLAVRDIRDVFLREARVSGRRTRDATKRFAPRLQDKSTLGSSSQGRRRGMLANAIAMFAIRSIRYAVVVGPRKAFGASLRGYPRAFYPAHLEYGHTVGKWTAGSFKKASLSETERAMLRRYGATKMGLEKKVGARPYMRQGWLATQNPVDLSTRVRDGLEDAMRRELAKNQTKRHPFAPPVTGVRSI